MDMYNAKYALGKSPETCRERICTQAGDVARRHLKNNHVPGNEEREPIRDVTIS